MSRRVSLPAADDLFRPTAVPDDGRAAAAPGRRRRVHRRAAGTAKRAPSGRVRHDEKMTVYVTADELLDLEHARLTLRRAPG